MASTQIIEAALTWTGTEFQRGVRIAVSDDGVISSVGALPDAPTLRLKDRALLPGFVNAHSHAFQRGLRGRGEVFSQGAGSFWSWREEMYRLVESIDELHFYEVSCRVFKEMLAAGITTVGEFHYLHHASGESEDYQFDNVVLRAARDTGIRIVLLNTYYNAGGFDQPTQGAQKRFRTTPEKFWSHIDQLASSLSPTNQALGVAAHSIRAVPAEQLVILAEESLKRGMVLHMHVEEQQAEIEDCINAHGKTPMAFLNDQLSISPRFTAIHCTHTAEADMEEFLDSGGNVCICPLTEANLGDGIPNLRRILKCGGHVSLGTDSNSRLSMTEEIRWLEYVARLASRSRGVCTDDSGSVARKLLGMATTNGARSLGIKAGRIQQGYVGDFATLDLTSPSLAGWEDANLLDALIFGTGNDAIAEVCVGGTWINQSQ